MRIIDISMPLENDVQSDPAGFEPKIEYINHQQSMQQLQAFFPGLAPEDMPDDECMELGRAIYSY